MRGSRFIEEITDEFPVVNAHYDIKGSKIIWTLLIDLYNGTILIGSFPVINIIFTSNKIKAKVNTIKQETFDLQSNESYIIKQIIYDWLSKQEVTEFNM